jgi:hypothetical protein
MRKMKAQAAMEYLMTYGWAILIIIVVVAALYAMGVLRIPTGVAPCSPCFPPGSDVTYIDHTADKLVLRVGPRDLYWVKVYVKGTVVSPDVPAEKYTPGTDLTFTSIGNFAGDVPIVVEVNVTESKLAHNITATLHGR